jgi:hypothetical protein
MYLLGAARAGDPTSDPIDEDEKEIQDAIDAFEKDMEEMDERLPPWPWQETTIRIGQYEAA